MTPSLDLEERQLPESQQSLVLSPRFLSALTEGQSGEGLLQRAFAETQRRAYVFWEKNPWTSPDENWLAAERSLLRMAPGGRSSGESLVHRSQRSMEEQFTAGNPPRENLESERTEMALGRDATNGVSSASVFSIPKLPLNRVPPSKMPLRSGFYSDRVPWPGGMLDLRRPRKHPLITPRTGGPGRCSDQEGTVFSMCTPRPGGASVPSPIPSRSESQSSDESFMDYENWDRIESIETTASQHDEVVMTVRSEKTTERSNFSLYGLYGHGQDAEVQVLRKVIGDLEMRLQEQEREIQAWRGGRHVAP